MDIAYHPGESHGEWVIGARLRRCAPAGTVDVSVGGEWSFAKTLRHLVMATDAWLGRAILGIEQPFHPIGQPNVEYETDGTDMSVLILGEEWEDHRYAVRDIDPIDTTSDA